VNGYFGAYWSSFLCDAARPMPTPVGEHCIWCDEVIVDGDQGTWHGALDGGFQPIHRECALREVTGGIGHLTDHQQWCVEADDPDGGRTPRQSALEVWALVNGGPE